MILAYLASATLLTAPFERHHKHRSTRCVAGAKVNSKATTLERSLRRRIVLTSRLAYLERKQQLLDGFLVRASTEEPVYQDDRRLRFGEIEIGPTAVTRDFLGSPVVRARLRINDASSAIIMVTAHLKSADGTTAEASIAVHMADRTSRTIELACPQAMTPVSIEWSVSRL